MTTKEEFQIWNQGTEYYLEGELESAVTEWRKLGPYSKIMFNIALCYEQTQDYDSAVVMYDKAIEADPYLCIAFFHKGHCLFKDGKYEDAEDAYFTCSELLRENDSIDYEQLGLACIIHRHEVLHNLAMCCLQLGDRDAHANYSVEARKCAGSVQQEQLVSNADRLLGVTNCIFQVSENKIKNLGKKSFLEGGKLIIKTEGEDNGFIGFTGATIIDPSLEMSEDVGTLIRARRSSMSALTVPRTHIRKTSEPYNTLPRHVHESKHRKMDSIYSTVTRKDLPNAPGLHRSETAPAELIPRETPTIKIANSNREDLKTEKDRGKAARRIAARKSSLGGRVKSTVSSLPPSEPLPKHKMDLDLDENESPLNKASPIRTASKEKYLFPPTSDDSGYESNKSPIFFNAGTGQVVINGNEITGNESDPENGLKVNIQAGPNAFSFVVNSGAPFSFKIIPGEQPLPDAPMAIGNQSASSSDLHEEFLSMY